MIKLPLSINDEDVAFDAFQLDGVWFSFSVAYNERIGRYYFDLYTEGVLVIAGIVMHPNTEVFVGHAIATLPKGALFLLGNREIESGESMKGVVGEGKAFNLFYIGAT